MEYSRLSDALCPMNFETQTISIKATAIRNVKVLGRLQIFASPHSCNPCVLIALVQRLTGVHCVHYLSLHNSKSLRNMHAFNTSQSTAPPKYHDNAFTSEGVVRDPMTSK